MTYVKPSQAELEAIYRAIEVLALSSTKVQETPRAICLGGQPGAGKSKVAQAAMVELGGPGVAYLIDIDKLREFHPSYLELNRQGQDRIAANVTHEDVSSWGKRLLSALMAGRRHVILDGTLGSPDTAEARLRMLKGSSYHVDVRALSVPAAVSTLGVYARYEHGKETSAYGRWLSEPVHWQAYEGLPRSLERIELNGIADRVALYHRDGAMVYENLRVDCTWQQSPMAAAVLEADRETTFTRDELAELVAGWTRVGEMALKRGAEPSYVVAVLDHRREISDALNRELDLCPANEYPI